MSDKIPCPCCGKPISEDSNLRFELSRGGNVTMVIDLMKVFEKIEELKLENADLAKLLAQYVFGKKGKEK